MSITRAKMPFERDFVQLPNSWMRDKRLSRRARGLLAELMTHEPGWKTSMEQLVAGGPEGRDAIRAAIKELEETGYLRRERTKSRGRFDGYDYILCDPASTVADFQATENPRRTADIEPSSADNQSTVFQSPENPPLRTPTKEHQEEPTVPQVLKPGDGASAAQELELPGLPSRTELVKAEPTPEAKIAKWAYDKTNGGLKYQAMQNLGRDAVRAGYAPGDVAKAMVAMFQAGRNVNQQSLAQYLQGIIRPNGTVPRPSTTDQRVMDALALKERVRARQAAQ